ncbi:hypothetical protein [Amycolatopsis sp. NPDC021455]|uniref:hypothetical protein n=1 Tax=Amycolatopsis sp. NPDC021455 TaxID=3154901 RepID=UPI0033F43EAE
MADAEILARNVELPPGRGGLIRHALQRISHSADGWHGPVETIEITRVIDVGRSGAVVIEVALRAGDEYRQRVVKIGPAGEMAREYANFRRFLAHYPAALCAPIQEATPGAVDAAEQRDGEVEAVVYAHVTAYAGRPRTPAPTLEDLVRAAFDGQAGVTEVRRLIERLFTKMSDPFHSRRKVRTQRSLRDLNPSLGPDLVLGPAEVQAEPIYAENVLDVSLGSGEFPAGRELRIADSGAREIRVETPDGRPVLAGHVIRSRFAEQRRKLDGAFTAVERSGESVVADGVPTADPAIGLRPVLTDPRFGRVRGVAHGDLNARNVMCVENEPLLIDFAETAGDRPVLSDAAWLEVSLLRDVFAGLSYGDLVRIQRCLALASRFRPLVNDLTELEAAFAAELTGSALVAFQVLHEIRTQAQLAFPGDDAWLDYLAQLHLSVYRTVKWDSQTPQALQAVHAAAAVAAEWLATEDPYAHWDDLLEPVNRLSPLVDLTRPDAVTAVTGLLATVDSRHPGIDAPGVDELRDRFVRARYLEPARELVIELSREHETFHVAQPVPVGRTAVLAGGPGAGKSRLLRELAHSGALDIARPGPQAPPLRMPLLVTAAGLPEDLPRETLVLGAVHLLLDGVDELPGDERNRIAAWSRSLLERFPRVRLTVAARNGAWAADAFGIPVIELRSWGDWEISRFLQRFELPESTRDATKKEILDVHRADGVAPPGFVAMIAEAVTTARQPFGYSYQKYFGAGLTEGELAALGSVAAAAVDTDRPVRPGVDVSAFVDRGILEPTGPSVRFRRRAERDFFAARALSREAGLVPERARSFAWRDVCLFAARLPSTPDAVVDRMVRSVGTADPRYAARLLSFRPAIAPGHLPAWETLLADPAAGSYAHRVAADALLLTAIPAARQALGDILLRETTPASTQLDILDVLGPHVVPNEADAAFGHWVRGVLGALLTGDYAAGVRVAAISVIKAGQLRGLEVLLAELFSSAEPAVAAAADDVLRSFKVLVPDRLAEARAALTPRHLADLEARLPALFRAEDIREANRRRVELLERHGTRAELLCRRFRYGIASSVGDLLEEAGHVDRDPRAASRLPVPADLPEEEAVALAHRILRDSPQDRDSLVFAARVDSPPHLLLIAAAAVSSPASVDHAANLVAELAPIVTADRIEGLAALGQAIATQDRRRGFTVTRQATRVLRDRDIAERWHWSWRTMLAHTSPGPHELDRLLADGVDGALEELAKYGPSWDLLLQPVPPLGAAARDFLLRKSHEDESEWVLAVAAARLTNTLPRVFEIAGKRDLATVAERVSSGRYGIVESTPRARVLAALGALARESAEPDTAHRLLAAFDTAGLHPSVEAGRLAGLAFLGDWEPLLLAVPGDGGPLDTASHQAIGTWVPGPCTPAGLRDPGDVAARLLRLRAEPGTTPERRSLLDELIHDAEQSHGNLLPRPQ